MKKNKRMKIGIAASLLITPAIVAQAEQVQASETDTAETIVAKYKVLNESTSATAIGEARTNFNANKSAYETILTTVQIGAIDAKLDYLEKFIELEKKAKDIKTHITNKIVTPSGNLEEDITSVKAEIAKFQADFEEMKGKLPKEPADLFSNLKTLTMDAQAFSNESISIVLLDAITKNEAYIPMINDYIDKNIQPILDASSEPVKGEAYVNATNAAKKNLGLEAGLERVLKVQLLPTEPPVTIEKFIADALKNIAAAETVSSKISALKPEELTSTNIELKMKAINDAYLKLTDFQKALVLNYGDIAKYQEVIQVVAAIKALPSLKIETQEFRNELPGVENKFGKLPSDLQSLVSNSAKLKEYRLAVDNAIKVDDLITFITLSNLETALPKAQAAYKLLSANDRKYVLKTNVTLLTDWESSNKNSSMIVKQINDIPVDSLKQLVDPAIADSKKIQTITSFITKARMAEASYAKIKAGENEEETKSQKLVTNRARLEGLIPLINATDTIIKLNVSSDAFETNLASAIALLNSWDASKVLEADQANIAKLKEFLSSYLTSVQGEKQAAENLKQTISALKETKPVSLSAITEARAKYNAMTANGRKLVSNIKDLEALEKQYKDAISVVALINALNVEAKDFARKTVSAQTAYEKLALASKEIVDNKAKLDELLPIAQLMIEIDGISSSAKDFYAKLENAKTKYNAIIVGEQTKPEDAQKEYLAAAKYRLATEYGPKLTTNQGIIDGAKAMEDKIEALKNKTGQLFMNDLKMVSDEYKRLNSTIKRNVRNAKVLTELERDYQATLRVIDQIDKLPVNTDRSFSSKVVSAKIAYERLTEKQKNDVFNYTTKLQTIVKAAELIGRIDKLQISSRTYQQDVAAIRAEYGKLTPAEQALVHNISKLENAEIGMTQAEEVMKLIDLAIPTAENYLEKLVAARDAYNKLPRNEQRLVTNLKDLTSRERAVMPVLKLDADILALDPSNAKTFISRYNSAQKAYEKLKIAERTLLMNGDKLMGELTQLYQVMNAINLLKNTSKTFIEETQAARALYNALSSELQAKVSNYDVLKGHEINVEGGSVVDAMIRELNNAAPQEFIAKVKEARAAYNALSSTNKKAVTLADELKAQEQYIKNIEVAIKAIDDLSNPKKDLSRQFTTVNKALQKLDEKQKTYVTNLDKYSNLANVIHVYTLIANLKPSDKYYQGNLEAAKVGYDRLSEEEKLKVTNYYKLQEAMLDMTEVQKVTSIIASLNPNASSYFADIEKAIAAYKEIPSSSRKQVLNYPTLQQAEKDMKAALNVIKQIDQLDSTLRTYESRTKSAQKAYERLTASQKPLITNYNKLQAAIFELGL